ncbi:MAG TPA: diadenylate cyclase CdaA [Geomobilimonas sp.]|nr:diadenylate cyclase CdaA [Geomobilimonas sp.]
MLASLHNWQWLVDLLDILLLAYVIYRLMLLVKGSMAARVMSGLIVLLACHGLFRLTGFQTVNWLLDNLLGSIVLVLVIIFQHDIRRALVALSRSRYGKERDSEAMSALIEELVLAAEGLASKKIGALMVVERGMSLDTYMAVGTEIDAKVTSEIISSIFLPYSPIHDGAVIIQHGKLTRAGCFLPLTQNPDVNKALGTRHRAAIGLTEIADAVVIVVSEETGSVSVAVGGKITRDLQSETLRRVLNRLLEARWLT